MTETTLIDNGELRAVQEFYIAQANWLIHHGREDLIDFVADEYERDLRSMHDTSTGQRLHRR